MIDAKNTAIERLHEVWADLVNVNDAMKGDIEGLKAKYEAALALVDCNKLLERGICPPESTDCLSCKDVAITAKIKEENK